MGNWMQKTITIFGVLALAWVSVSDTFARQQERTERDKKTWAELGETGNLNTIPLGLRSGGGGGSLVHIEVRFLFVTDNFFRTIGVDLSSAVEPADVDRAEVMRDIPILGGLFSGGARNSDFKPERKVGGAYLFNNALIVSTRMGPIAGSQAADGPALTQSGFDSWAQGVTASAASTSAKTTIALPNGGSLALGGLTVFNRDAEFKVNFDRVATQVAEGVPALNKIPKLGWLFKNKVGDAYNVNDSLMILISPTIMRGERE